MKKTKKIWSVLMSLLMGFTVMTTPVLAESPSDQEPAEEPEVTENQKTEEPEASEEEIKETEETPEVSEEPAEAPEAEKEPEETDQPAETPEIKEDSEKTEGQESAEEEQGAAEEQKTVEEEQKAEEPEITEETEEPVTQVNPDPVTYNGVTVTVSYPSDAFGGKNVTLVVGDAGDAEIKALEELGKEYKAVDISFVDEEGNKVQPEEGKQISVSLDTDGMKNTGDFEVVHVDGEGVVRSVTAKTETSNEVTEKVKVGETTKTVTVPAETKTVTVKDYKTVKEKVPAKYGYRYILKYKKNGKKVKASVADPILKKAKKDKNGKPIVKSSKYYVAKEKYLVKKAYTKTTKKQTGTHKETQVIKKAYSYEVKEDVVEDVTFSDVEASFKAASFSVYAVIGGGPTPESRATVIFYNGENEIARVYIKNRDTLLTDTNGDGVINDDDRLPTQNSYLEDIVTDPGVGTLETGELFRGWTVDANYTVSSTPMTIYDLRKYLAEEVIPDIKEGDEVKVHAMIFKYFNIIYYGLDEGVSLGTDTIILDRNASETTYKVDCAFTAQANAKFMGWKASAETYSHIAGGEAETIYPNKTDITITGDVDFHVEAPTGHWLIYHENGKGALYNPPDFYLEDVDTVERPSLKAYNEQTNPLGMVRNGYTFEGWYILKEGASISDVDKDAKGYYIIDDQHFDEFHFGAPLHTPKTNIYAKWKEVTTAPYTVVFWTEKLSSVNDAQDDKVYDLVASYPGEGTVGQPIPYEVHENKDEDYIRVGSEDYHYTGFCYNASKTVDVNITPEGDAVLNLYFNRIEYNLRFYLYRRNGNNYQNAHYPKNNGTNVWGMVNGFNDGQPTTDYPLQHEMVNGYDSYYFTISAYYGENIGDKWPSYDSIYGFNSGFSRFEVVSYILMQGAKLRPAGIDTQSGKGTVKGVINTMDDMILGATNDKNGNFLICRFDDSYYSWTYHIYFETIPGKTYTDTITLNGKTYYRDHDDPSRSSNNDGAQQNGALYDGFTPVMKEDGKTTYYDNVEGTTTNSPSLNYYYDRKSFEINYKDGVYYGGIDHNVLEAHHEDSILNTSESILYGADIPEEYKNYKPTRSNETGYIFAGWYMDAACKVPYTFTTMPLGGITVYAKWIETQYRIFLHPNAENADSNPNLDWGSSNVKLSFRVNYGDSINLPKGVWTDGKYEFVGWFADKDCESDFFDDSFLMNEKTVNADYDWSLPENYTDEMDKWGNGATYNSDQQNNRTWITKKLDLYGLWREVLEGSDGINVEYSAIGFDVTDPDATVSGKVNNSVLYTDEFKYLDRAKAVATSAAVPDEENYQFLYWVVQKWNGTAYEDVINENGELLSVFPGDSFTVLARYAKKEEKPESNPENPSYKYTVRLRAEYGPKQIPKHTYIDWYRNYESDTGITGRLHRNEHLQINEHTDIFGAPEREGYKFLGWARESEYQTDSSGISIADDDHVIPYYDVDEDDLYLKWEDDKYWAKDDKDAWVPVEEVFADDIVPYQALYAVWEYVGYFYVFHSNNGKVDRISMISYLNGETYDLTEAVAEGHLYGGYFKGYFNVTDKEAIAASVSKTPATTYTYDGSKVYEKNINGVKLVRYWNKTGDKGAYTADGTKLVPIVDTVYYLREVPEAFLGLHVQVVYDYTNSNAIDDLYLVTTADNNIYDQVGFRIETEDNKADFYASYSIQSRGSTSITRITPDQINGIGGTLGVWNGVGKLLKDEKYQFTVKPYWVTLDNVRVYDKHPFRTFNTGDKTFGNGDGSMYEVK